MQASSPFELFSPIHLAWLYRRHEARLDVTAADLDSIEAAQPEAACDRLFAKYRSQASAGKLYRRPGRKPPSTKTLLRLWAARFAIDDEMAEIWARRRSGEKPRGYKEEPPVIQAAEKIAREFRFGGGQSLLNRLSREQIR